MYDRIETVPRQPDGRGLYLWFTGGLRAAKVDEDQWMIEPVRHEGCPCRVGVFDQPKLNALLKRAGLHPIAFHDISWVKGRFHSSWMPLISGTANHMRGPSDLWSSLASNLARQRTDHQLRQGKISTHEDVAAILDARTLEESFAHSISLSLRSMDICVEQIAEFYNEQLIDMIATDVIDGRYVSNLGDSRLFAFVHSFFLHFGAARDYLGAFIADRLGKNASIDSMFKFVRALEPNDFGVDATLDLLVKKELIKAHRNKPNEWETFGWLHEASELRNRLVHRRPYGARYAERSGRVVAIPSENNLYRYTRNIVIGESLESDVLDMIRYHYRETNELFRSLAEASGEDISMMKITDADIISVEIDKP